MCRIFIEADPELYRTRTKSLRLHGVSTSIRLEVLYWTLLAEIAGRDGMQVNQLIIRLYDELVEKGADISNFTSFLRVCCSRYLALQLAGRIPKDQSVSIRGLDADYVLSAEPLFHSQVEQGARDAA